MRTSVPPSHLGKRNARAAFGAILGICLTTLFLIGVLERRDRTILRMGYDSAAVLVVYFGGLAILYGLK